MSNIGQELGSPTIGELSNHCFGSRPAIRGGNKTAPLFIPENLPFFRFPITGDHAP